jgi:hypothetical protein
MSNTRICPKCQKDIPLGKMWCECGHATVGSQMRAEGEFPICQDCLALTETRYVEMQQNIGLLVMRLYSSVEGHLCRNCISQRFWSMSGITLVLGWWGVISFFFTPYILISNLVQYLRSLKMRRFPRTKNPKTKWPKQLVGQMCSLCSSKISSAYDSRYCEVCSLPIHNTCARKEGSSGCAGCGGVPAAESGVV